MQQPKLFFRLVDLHSYIGMHEYIHTYVCVKACWLHKRTIPTYVHMCILAYVICNVIVLKLNYKTRVLILIQNKSNKKNLFLVIILNLVTELWFYSN